MKTGSRPQYYRIRRMVQMVREGAETGCLANSTDFMNEFEVSRRTVARDLDFLRDEERAPLAYDDARHGFRLTDETYMHVIGCDAIVEDRNAIATSTLAQPFSVIVALPNRAQKKPPVVAPVRQVIRKSRFKIARCVWHRHSFPANRLNVNFQSLFGR